MVSIGHFNPQMKRLLISVNKVFVLFGIRERFATTIVMYTNEEE